MADSPQALQSPKKSTASSADHSSVGQLPSSVLQQAVQACLSAAGAMSPGVPLPSEVASLLEHTLTRMYPSLVSQFLKAFNSLQQTIRALEEKLLDAAESIKRRNREILVVKEYHKVLLKKYRLLVTKEEFEDHLNGYDKKLKLDVSTDDPIAAGKKYDKDRQDKASAIMKVYEKAEPEIVPKQTGEASKSALAVKQEQEKKERHEPVTANLTKPISTPKETPKSPVPKNLEEDKSNLKLKDNSQEAPKKAESRQPLATAAEPVGPLREIFAVPLPATPSLPAATDKPTPKSGKAAGAGSKVRQNPATPPRLDQSGNHSEFYTIDLEQSTFRSVDEDGRMPGKKRTKDDSKLAREIFGTLPQDLSVIEAIPGGKGSSDRVGRKAGRKQEQFLDANEDRDLILAAVGHKSLDNKGKIGQPSRNQLLRKKDSDAGLKPSDIGGRENRNEGGSKSTDKQPSNGAPKLPPLNIGGGPRSFNSGLVHNIDYGRFGAAKVDGIMEKKYYQMS